MTQTSGRYNNEPRAAAGVSRPRVLFIGSGYAGHGTRFANLVRNTRDDERIQAQYRLVTGWQEGGFVERLPILSQALKGRMRAELQAADFGRLPRPDAIWTSAGELFAPYLWTQVGSLRRPFILDVDATPQQLESFSSAYFGRPPKHGLRRLAGVLRRRAVFASATMFVAWSSWALNGLLASGVPATRIRLVPPGVDLETWRVPLERRRDGPLRLLFVGGDFERKGGHILLDVFRHRFRGRCELDIVTKAHGLTAPPGVRIHHADPNSDELRRLYSRADLFVLPTQAECFGLATLEAMASGLPAIVGDVGGVRDTVVHDETGWLVDPIPGALASALETALARRDQLAAMGMRARQVAEERFDGRRNDRRLIDLVLEEVQRWRIAPGRSWREVAAR